MAEISMTGIKTNSTEQVLEILDYYFSKHNLHLVEEKIGSEGRKYQTGNRKYRGLKEYDRQEIEPHYERNSEASTNFDFFVNIKDNLDWCVLAYPVGLADLTLNIDNELTSLLSRELNTLAFDRYEYTGVNLYLTRSFKNGQQIDLLYSLEGPENVIFTTEGYFEQLNELDKENLSQEESQKRLDIIAGFWNHIGYKDVYFYNEEFSSRRPLYLKGVPEDIHKFLSNRKEALFIV